MTLRIVFPALLVLSFSPAFAAEDITAHKQEILTEIDQRIAKMQEHRGCIAGATTKEAMMQCRQAMKDFHKGERMEHLERRKGRLDQKMQKLQGNPSAGE